MLHNRGDIYTMEASYLLTLRQCRELDTPASTVHAHDRAHKKALLLEGHMMSVLCS
jgi:hypothetical protein